MFFDDAKQLWQGCCADKMSQRLWLPLHCRCKCPVLSIVLRWCQTNMAAAERTKCCNVFDFVNIAAVVSSSFIPADFLIFQLTFILKADGATFWVHGRYPITRWRSCSPRNPFDWAFCGACRHALCNDYALTTRSSSIRNQCGLTSHRCWPFVRIKFGVVADINRRSAALCEQPQFNRPRPPERAQLFLHVRQASASWSPHSQRQTTDTNVGIRHSSWR